MVLKSRIPRGKKVGINSNLVENWFFIVSSNTQYLLFPCCHRNNNLIYDLFKKSQFYWFFYLFIFQTLFHSMDHHWKDNIFATCGDQVDIWDEMRAEPIRTFTWGVDSIQSVKFNPVEVSLFFFVVNSLLLFLILCCFFQFFVALCNQIITLSHLKGVYTSQSVIVIVVTQVQILINTVCISHSTHTLRKV